MNCPHCDVVFHWYTQVGDGPATPIDGSNGICARCLMWWEQINGQLTKYQPTADEQIMVVLQLLHRKRAGIAHARNN